MSWTNTIFRNGNPYYTIVIDTVTVNNDFSPDEALINVFGYIRFEQASYWGVRLTAYVKDPLNDSNWLYIGSTTGYALDYYSNCCQLSGLMPVYKDHNFHDIEIRFSAESETVDGIGGITEPGSCNAVVTSPQLAPKDNYTVKYNANGGLASSTPAQQTKWYNETLALSTQVPTRTYYKFNNWRASSGTVTYAPGGRYTGNEELTLVAQWDLLKATVYYNPNGGTIATNTAASTQWRISNNRVQRSTDSGTTWSDFTTTVTAGTNGIALLPVGGPPITKPGYHIVATQAWSMNSGGTGNLFSQNGSTTTNPVTTRRLNNGTEITSNITKTLFVKWEPDTYDIRYNANTGNANSTPAVQTKTHGTPLVLSSIIPTKNNIVNSYTVTFNYNGNGTNNVAKTTTLTTSYSFQKWNTKNNGTGTSYAPGTNYTVNATATLYAQWKETSNWIDPITLDLPTRTGCIFGGWYKSDETTKVWDGIGTYYPNSSITLYAKWEKLPVSIDKIHLRNGINEWVSFPEWTYEIQGNRFTIGQLLASAAGGSNFSGWCTTAADIAEKTVFVTNVATGVSLTENDLIEGLCITVRFTNTNTANSPTLNINNFGAKPIYRNYSGEHIGNDVISSWADQTSISLIYTTGNNYADGWVLNDNSTNTCWRGICPSLPEDTQKTVSCFGFYLVDGTRISVQCTTSNTVPAPTININSTGEKPIYFDNSLASAEHPFLWDEDAVLDLVYNASLTTPAYQVVCAPISSSELDNLLNSF